MTMFTGTGTAIVTPFRKEGSIDFRSFEKLLKHQLDNKVDYLVALGTTGESVTMSKDEKHAVVDFVKEVNNKRVPLVVGMGGNNTQEVIDCIKSFDFEGIDAILSVAPMYNKPTQRGLYEHFKAIATCSPVPVMLYNVPGRTASNMTAETTIKLANEFTNIVAIKEASGDVAQMAKILRDKPAHFELITGDDLNSVSVIAMGGVGVISVASNAFPEKVTSYINKALKGDFASANTELYKMIDFIETLFIEGNPAGIKAALQILDIIPSYLRLPLVKVGRSTYSKLASLIDELK